MILLAHLLRYGLVWVVGLRSWFVLSASHAQSSIVRYHSPSFFVFHSPDQIYITIPTLSARSFPIVLFVLHRIIKRTPALSLRLSILSSLTLPPTLSLPFSYIFLPPSLSLIPTLLPFLSLQSCSHKIPSVFLHLVPSPFYPLPTLSLPFLPFHPILTTPFHPPHEKRSKPKPRANHHHRLRRSVQVHGVFIRLLGDVSCERRGWWSANREIAFELPIAPSPLATYVLWLRYVDTRMI